MLLFCISGFMLFIRIIGEVCLKSRNASFVIHHLDGSYGALIALVAKHTATSLLGLLHCVASQQAINDGDFACSIQLSQTLRSTLTDIVKMRSVAFDDASDSYNGIYLTRVYKGRRTKDKLEATGNGLNKDILLLSTMKGQRIKSALQKGACDFTVPFAYHDTELHVGSIGYGSEIVIRKIV